MRFFYYSYGCFDFLNFSWLLNISTMPLFCVSYINFGAIFKSTFFFIFFLNDLKTSKIIPWIRPLNKELFIGIFFVDIQLQIFNWWKLVLSQGLRITLCTTIFLTWIERSSFRGSILLIFIFKKLRMHVIFYDFKMQKVCWYSRSIFEPSIRNKHDRTQK